jgi:hypothetical protein
MAITGTTPPKWLISNTILLYKKNDPYNLDNYKPITLAMYYTNCGLRA